MIQALKAEFLKLRTVRSTLVLSSIAFLLVLIGSSVAGYHASSHDQYLFSTNVLQTATVVSFFSALVSVLLMAHEYRYNTIVYALSLSKSRTKVLLAKIVTVLTYTIVITLVADCLGILALIAGASVAGHHLSHQDFDAVTVAAKSLYYCVGFALAALLFTTLLRNITASVAVLFIVPNTVEGIFSLFLKHNITFLPFSALQQVISPSSIISKGPTPAWQSPTRGAFVFAVWLIVGWAIAWILFLRRDAN